MRSSTDAMVVYSTPRQKRDSVVARMEASDIRDSRDGPACPPAVAGVMRATTLAQSKTAQPSAGHPFDERRVHRLRLLHGRKLG
jgi:hypothetical protein